MKSFLVFLLLVAAAAMSGAVFRPEAWYDDLLKPALTPPGWLFTPVWLILYVMIARAGHLVWKRAGLSAGRELAVWGLQLASNALWSWLFFGIQRPLWALLDLSVLLGLIIWFIKLSRRLSRRASWLFVPYALWAGFAFYLNLGIVILNP